MKFIYFSIFTLLCVCTGCATENTARYTNKYDVIHVDSKTKKKTKFEFVSKNSLIMRPSKSKQGVEVGVINNNPDIKEIKVFAPGDTLVIEADMESIKIVTIITRK